MRPEDDAEELAQKLIKYARVLAEWGETKALKELVATCEKEARESEDASRAPAALDSSD